MQLFAFIVNYLVPDLAFVYPKKQQGKNNNHND